MHFLADENVSLLVVEQLRAAGFEVATVGLTKPGASDAEVLAMATGQGYVLITEDRDFGELVIRQQVQVQGVVLLELDRLSNAAEAGRVAAVVSANMDKLPGSLCVIEPARVRMRPLRR
jgi:predicted nuclease of predicted toxin-antitoxin system